MNVILRNLKNKQKYVEAVNVSISQDTPGAIIEVKNPEETFLDLDKDGFKVTMEGKLLVVDCKSVYCY